MLLLKIYQQFGLVPLAYDPRPYATDWHMHRSDERYLAGLLQHGRQVATPQPGDVVAYRYGRTYSHGGIVVNWPTIIHAHLKDGSVVQGDGESGDLAGRKAVFFSVIKD